MAEPTLYSFRRCPYAIRARMAIRASGLNCQLREVALRNKPQEMLNLSPKGTVPVLSVGAQVIDESIDIMDWALTESAVDGWHRNELQHDLVRQNDGEFKANLDRYKYFDRYPDKPQDAYLQAGLFFLDELENVMRSGKSNSCYLVTAHLSALDVAIFPFIRQFAFVDKARFDALSLPRVQQWLITMLHSPLFESVMYKHTAWKPEDDMVVYV